MSTPGTATPSMAQSDDYSDSIQAVPQGRKSDLATARHTGSEKGDRHSSIFADDIGNTTLSLQDDNNRAPPSEWYENCNAPRRQLGFWQISSLVINSVVGNGIFTQPGYILLLTHSKPVALALWAAGGLYTLVTAIVFVEFGIALPFNGGPMVYLDECYDRPRLLALTIFSIFRILLGTSEGNCRSLALNLLVLANPSVPTSDFSSGLVSLVSIVVLAVACLLIYFMLPLCLVLNVPLAAFKIVLLLVIPIYGLITLKGERGDPVGYGATEPGYETINVFQAMTFVIYSYQGFLNANCIAGEVRQIKRNLHYAAWISVLLITCLYMFMVAVLYAVLDYESLTSLAGRSNATALMIAKASGSQTAIGAAMGISSFGTLLIQVYTLARVKQAIAWRRIIPFYKFFGRQSPFGTPGGGLLLHAIFTSIPLLAFSKSTPAFRSFITGIYSWSRELLTLLLGIGLLRLKERMNPGWNYTILKRPVALYIAAVLFSSSSLLVIIVTALSHTPGQIPGWYWPVTTSVVIAFATIYWGILRGLMLPLGSSRTVGAVLGFEPRFHNIRVREESSSLRYLLWEAEKEGMPRFITYEVTGFPKRMHKAVLAVYDFVFMRHTDSEE